MNLIDTHCHLNFKAFNDDFFSVARSAQKEGIEAIVIPGSNLETSLAAVERAAEINDKLNKKFAFAAIGIHPVHENELNSFVDLEKIAAPLPPALIAIGEAGLDFFHDKQKKSKTAQIELFNRHVDLAIKLDLPLICHNRDADEEILEIMENRKMPKRVVFHCFSSNWKFAEKVLAKGFYLSFTGNITYGNKDLKKVIGRTPLNRIMIETDAPYLVPEPLRSQGVKRNEPSYVVNVANKIVQIRQLSLEEVASATTQNAIEFFGI